MRETLIETIIGNRFDGAFALISRRTSSPAQPEIDVLNGSVQTFLRLEDIPSGRSNEPGSARQRYLALIPYRQITEVGFECIDDDESLQAIEIERHETISVPEVLARLPKQAVNLSGMGFDLSDEVYAETAQKIIDEEIGGGEGSNFVLSRSLMATVDDFTPAHALSLFGQLLAKETGAYWTFLIYINGRTFIGASPEQQITLRSGIATMNPISGTYRYPIGGPQIAGLLDFLNDEKETDELFMVVDEELKMFGRFCSEGGRLRGPFLKEMSRLAHTEYYIDGRTSASASSLLRSTLLAPTVTGSPIRNACRVIAKHERRGRGYYAGVVALIGSDATGEETMDSAILIRTADITADGELRIAVGSTIVRHSDAEQEAAETTAKAHGLIAAFTSLKTDLLANDKDVRQVLENRNKRVANFWRSNAMQIPDSQGAGQKILVLDAEDDFTQMLAQQLRALGLEPSVHAASGSKFRTADYDLVLLGPGPGSPLDDADQRVLGIRRTMELCLATRKPFVAVCLSHQILSARLGLNVERLILPNQGLQKHIDFFGKPVVVGFYNTFSAKSAHSASFHGREAIEICKDAVTSEVHAIRGSHFTSMQFHPESILSIDGKAILSEEIYRLTQTIDGRRHNELDSLSSSSRAYKAGLPIQTSAPLQATAPRDQ